jgi:hypothetical protein
MTTREIAKKVVKTVVGVSTSFTVSNALKNNVASDNPVQKTEIYIGSAVVGMMVADAAERYIDKVFDTVVGAYEDLKKN